MKVQNIIIIILVSVVAVLSFIVYKQKFGVRYETSGQGRKVYIVGLTESVDRLTVEMGKTLGEKVWMNDRLNACLTKLEVERGLEPIPVEDSFRKMYGAFTSSMNSPMSMGYTDPNSTYAYVEEKEVPFFEPYTEPDFSASNKEERSIRYLQCRLNLISLSHVFNRKQIQYHIDNLEKRLKRIEAFDLELPSKTNLTD